MKCGGDRRLVWALSFWQRDRPPMHESLEFLRCSRISERIRRGCLFLLNWAGDAEASSLAVCVGTTLLSIESVADNSGSEHRDV